MSLTWTPATDDDPEFTITTATQHSVLAGRSTADAHPASAITTDNDWNGNLTAAGTNLAAVLDVIDDLALGGGGGAVDSVNGETGVVVLDAADVGAVPITAVGLLAGETNRGDWSGATAYSVGDVVHDHNGDGGVYLCTAATTNEQPSLTAAKWTEIDGTGREFAVGAGSHAGTAALSIGPGATSDGGGLSVGPYAASGVYGLSVGVYAVSGAAGLSVGTQATSGVGGLAIGPGATSGAGGLSVGSGVTTGDYEVSIAGIYKGTVDSSDPTLPTGASIATGFVDLPETADVTNPAVGSQRLVARTDGLYVRDEAGAEVGPIGAGGSGIPATIIDAAGDLIIGTAADTAARLAVGTSGQVLTSNGTTAAWAAPSLPPLTFASGAYYTLGGGESSGTTASPDPAGRLVAHPLWLAAGTYDRIGVYVGSAGNATWRLGIYTDSGLAPGSLVLDAGTLTMSAGTGVREISTTITIPSSGVYWAAVLIDAHTSSTTVTGWQGGTGSTPNLPWLGHRAAGNPAGRGRWAASASGVTTGALPASFPSPTWTDVTPQILFRKA